ncbi:MAG: hypothetical protein JSU63_06175 [Phycisphaerales bacterium]|nr:MAG: hypothetical protein JSU63_06175 [Phycisphaerales bacterium]
MIMLMILIACAAFVSMLFDLKDFPRLHHIVFHEGWRRPYFVLTVPILLLDLAIFLTLGRNRRMRRVYWRASLYGICVFIFLAGASIVWASLRNTWINGPMPTYGAWIDLIDVFAFVVVQLVGRLLFLLLLPLIALLYISRDTINSVRHGDCDG